MWKITNFSSYFFSSSSVKASPGGGGASTNNHVKGEPLNCPLCHRECKHFHYLKGHISMHFRQKLKEKVTNWGGGVGGVGLGGYIRILHYVWFSLFWSHFRRTNALFASKAKINVVWNFFDTPGTLRAPSVRKNFKQRWF